MQGCNIFNAGASVTDRRSFVKKVTSILHVSVTWSTGVVPDRHRRYEVA
jgi:hypothetical protein